MYSNIDDVKKELKELCLEYVTILEKLKDEKMITEETFEKCSSTKKNIFRRTIEDGNSIIIM
ncbi:hypothetical protein [Clostridioides difficile]|uniref:hypothetical protein n=1 Tax=Clostridioides difficile TaxID=1496 RepID=UPI00017F5D9F|nr:hypothetical protein [Clostridioides difficile]